LAISGRLISLMGGSIGVESEPGTGSTFWFLVPVETVQAGAAGLPEPQPAVAAPLLPAGLAQAPSVVRHILIVEDNPVNQMVALRAVRGLGYRAEVVSGGQAALEAWGRDSFDLILMDCQMPDMDGYEAAGEIRRREDGTGRVPIVAMTANTMKGDEEKCRASGMDDYLPKPVRLKELARILERWLPVSRGTDDRLSSSVDISAPGPAGNS
jgi:CheY-like chemotaxis protein